MHAHGGWVSHTEGGSWQAPTSIEAPTEKDIHLTLIITLTLTRPTSSEGSPPTEKRYFTTSYEPKPAATCMGVEPVPVTSKSSSAPASTAASQGRRWCEMRKGSAGCGSGGGTFLGLGEGVVLACFPQVVACLLHFGRRLGRLLGGIYLSWSLRHRHAPSPHAHARLERVDEMIGFRQSVEGYRGKASSGHN